MKDDEFEGDEQAQTPMKGMLPPFLDGMRAEHKIALEIAKNTGELSALLAEITRVSQEA